MEQTKQEQFIIRRIGGTTYKVRVAFSETAVETMEEKILRMIRNERVTNEFASYVLKPHNDLKIKLWMQANKGKACLLALVLMLLIIGGCQFIKTKADKVYWSNYYITATGTKYHRENCMFVKGKKSVKQLTWDEVRSGQYEPCQICLPQD